MLQFSRSHHYSQATAAWLLALTLLAGGTAPLRAEPVKEERIRALQPAIARLSTSTGSGTGFLIRSDGVMLTAFHVVAGASAVWAHFPGGTACRVEGVLALYPERDLAVVKLRQEELPPGVPVMSLADDAPQAPGAEIAAVGYPGGGPMKVIRGRLLLGPPRGKPGALQLHAELQPGCSGGPVLNGEGQVVGVAVSGLRSEKLSFASGLAALTSIALPAVGVRTFDEINGQEEESADQQYGRAQGVMQFWRDRDDDSPEVRSARQWSLLQFNEARRKRPSFADAHYGAAVCYAALERRPEAVAALQRTLEAQPDHLAARLALASTHLGEGKTAEAERAVQEILKSHPKLGLARRQLAACYRKRKQAALAESELRAALADDPDDARSHLALGNLLAEVRRRDAAVAEYRKVAELRPDDAELAHDLGEAYTSLKLYREAAASHEAALRTRPQFAAAHYGLALACLGLGDRDRARRSYEVLDNLKSSHAPKLARLLAK